MMGGPRGMLSLPPWTSGRPTTFFRTCSRSPASSAGSSRSRCRPRRERPGSDLYQAALAICFGFFFDTADGRVARLTKTQTDLGRDLDSLADGITFGVAPAMMVYKWGLTSFGRLGIFVAGLFVCAGVMRLARFNVLSRREEAAGHQGPGKYTLGLSIPAAASVLVLMVIVAHNVDPYRIASDGVLAAVVLVLSYLMVSRIKFRSFKDLRLTRRTIEMAVLLVACWVLVAMNGVDKALIFLVLIMAYIVLGLAETLLLMRRQFIEQRREKERRRCRAAAVDDLRATTTSSASSAPSTRRSTRNPRRVPNLPRWAPTGEPVYAGRSARFERPIFAAGLLPGLPWRPRRMSRRRRARRSAPDGADQRAEQHRELDEGAVGRAQLGGEGQVHPTEELAGAPVEGAADDGAEDPLEGGGPDGVLAPGWPAAQHADQPADDGVGDDRQQPARDPQLEGAGADRRPDDAALEKAEKNATHGRTIAGENRAAACAATLSLSHRCAFRSSSIGRAASCCTRPACRARIWGRRRARWSTSSPPPARAGGRCCPSGRPATATRPTAPQSAFAGQPDPGQPRPPGRRRPARRSSDRRGVGDGHLDERVRAPSRSGGGIGDPDFRRFVARRPRDWLDDFALFRALKRAHGGVQWTRWAAAAARPRPGGARAARRRARRGDRLRAVRAVAVLRATGGRCARYAHERGVGAHRRLPIFVAHDSADVWQHRELFYLDDAGEPTLVAGVPPDYFSATGQRWGNPLYRWARDARRPGYRLVDRPLPDDARALRRRPPRPLHRLRALLGDPGDERRPRSTAAGARARRAPSSTRSRAALGDAAAHRRGPRRGHAGGRRAARPVRVARDQDPAVRVRRPIPQAPTSCRTTTRAARSSTPARTTTTPPSAGSTTRRRRHAQRRRRPSTSGATALRYLGARRRRRTGDPLGHDPGHAWPRWRDVAIVPLQDVLGLGSEARMNRPGTADRNWAWRLARPARSTPAIAERLRELRRDLRPTEARRLETPPDRRAAAAGAARRANPLWYKDAIIYELRVALVLRQQRRRHRRLPRARREARLPPGPRRHRDLAPAVLPLAPARRRLRHRRLHRRPPRRAARSPTSSACSTRRTGAACASSPSWS